MRRKSRRKYYIFKVSGLLHFQVTTDNTAQGGDIDLMLEFSKPIENPALIAAQLSAKISRVMDGRKVDVILMAPNLMLLPIHEVALKEGVLL